jgi:hypothetical protein
LYHHFLANDSPVFLERVPLHHLQHMWFVHDGAPYNFLRTVRQHLNQALGEKWKGCGGPVNWPVLSPDLNALDFWLWRHVKALVYSAPINDLRGLSEISRTVIVLTASVKEMRGEAKVTLPQAHCIILPHDTALWTCIFFTRVLFRRRVSFYLLDSKI